MAFITGTGNLFILSVSSSLYMYYVKVLPYRDKIISNTLMSNYVEILLQPYWITETPPD